MEGDGLKGGILVQAFPHRQGRTHRQVLKGYHRMICHQGEFDPLVMEQLGGLEG